jgi:predicted nucleic acid-binding protein
MRLAVFDMNVLVSAGVAPGGVSATLIFDWVLNGEVQPVTSSAVLAEYREAVQRPKFRRYGFLSFWLEYLVEESLVLPDPKSWPYEPHYPNDAPFIALAHAAGAWLVTGNLKHFPEPSRNGVTVLSPADYLSYLAGD